MPDQRHESHHKICNLRYGTHGYGMSACKIQGVHLLKLKVSPYLVKTCLQYFVHPHFGQVNFLLVIV